LTQGNASGWSWEYQRRHLKLKSQRLPIISRGAGIVILAFRRHGENRRVAHIGEFLPAGGVGCHVHSTVNAADRQGAVDCKSPGRLLLGRWVNPTAGAKPMSTIDLLEAVFGSVLALAWTMIGAWLCARREPAQTPINKLARDRTMRTDLRESSSHAALRGTTRIR
jgi:hypothetical protein